MRDPPSTPSVRLGHPGSLGCYWDDETHKLSATSLLNCNEQIESRRISSTDGFVFVFVAPAPSKSVGWAHKSHNSSRQLLRRRPTSVALLLYNYLLCCSAMGNTNANANCGQIQVFHNILPSNYKIQIQIRTLLNNYLLCCSLPPLLWLLWPLELGKPVFFGSSACSSQDQSHYRCHNTLRSMS